MKSNRWKPAVVSLCDLEFRLGVKRSELDDLLKERGLLYRPFRIVKKQHPYPGKKRLSDAKPIAYREIDNPVKQLKEIQRRIVDRILVASELPDYMFGAVSGKSVALHASKHVREQAFTIVRLDIKSFYPNITCQHVYNVWHKVLRCSPPVARVLTKLTTHNYRLPQGAPTSPAIANLLLASILAPIHGLAQKSGLTITTWVDDIVISGKESRSLMESIRGTIAAHGFKIAPAKRVILGPRSEKEVTGVRLGRLGPRATRRKMSELRAAIFRLSCGQVAIDDMQKYSANLRGRIAHVASVCKADGDKLFSYAVRLNT